MPEEKTAYVYVRLPWAVHKILNDVASTQGVQVADLARDLIIEALNQKQVPPWYRLFARTYSQKMMSRVFINEARSYLKRGDNLRLAEVLEQAGKAGVDADEVLAIASELETADLSLSATVQDGVRILLALLGSDGRVLAAAAMELGKREGVSAWALQEAKRALKMTSKRDSQGWVWVREKDEQS